MTLPANIRVNALVPFPALVKGSGPVTVGKNNGVWTIGLDIIDLGLQNPAPGNYASDFVIVWDNVAKNFFRTNISALGATRTQRSVTVSPIVIAATDMILNVNINTGSPTCVLPAAASRAGVPLTFKDVGGQFASHSLTITPVETIDGAASITLSVNRQAVTLNPFNDGVNSGWFIT
jgi:hypothetical protein